MDLVHPRRLAIAVDDVYGQHCLGSMRNFLSCQAAPIQIASFLINLLRNVETNMTLSVYGTDNFYDIFSDMTALNVNDRKIDLYPFPLALTDEPWAYEYTGSTEWMPYFMYSDMRALTTSMRQSPIRFLTSPFRWNTWAAFITSILIASCITQLVRRLRNNNASMMSQISWFALFFLFAVYTSNLKALLAQPKPLDPFVSLRDLADQMAKGKRRIMLEEEHTRRWRLLVDDNLTKPEEFQLIQRVIEAKPEALVIAGNQTAVCRMLSEDPGLVFFGYDDLVQTLCGDLCLWQYRVTEYPVIMKAIPVLNMSSISSKMDVFLLAAFSYKEVLLNRLYKPRCGPLGSGVALIGMESFYGPLMLWILGLCVGVVVFCVEVAKPRVMYKHRFDV